MPDLVLYHFKSCLFCQKVFDYLNQRGIEIDMKDVRKDKNAREKLINTGGKYQVPCLFIDGQPLYESDDIIRWFDENY